MQNLEGKDVVIVEDIIDTGHTLVKIIEALDNAKVKSYKIMSLFYKPEAYQYDIPIDYIGLQFQINLL